AGQSSRRSCFSASVQSCSLSFWLRTALRLKINAAGQPASRCAPDEKDEVGGRRVLSTATVGITFPTAPSEPGMHAFHAPRLSRMDCSIPADLLAHPSEPAILKPIPGALRPVVGSPNLRLLPLLCDLAALS